jgi:hypothetical protein
MFFVVYCYNLLYRSLSFSAERERDRDCAYFQQRFVRAAVCEKFAAAGSKRSSLVFILFCQSALKYCSTSDGPEWLFVPACWPRGPSDRGCRFYLRVYCLPPSLCSPRTIVIFTPFSTILFGNTIAVKHSAKSSLPLSYFTSWP